MTAFLSPVETAAHTGLSLSTVHRALADGSLHGGQRVKGGKWRIDPVCADAWREGERCPHRSKVVMLNNRKVAS